MTFDSAKKLFSLLMIGMIFLMPVFLPVQTQAFSDVRIVFASNDFFSTGKYRFSDLKLIFGGDGTPNTYKAKLSAEEYERLQSDPAIIYSSIDAEIQSARIQVNDTYFTLNSAETSEQWYLPKIKIPEAWVYGTGSEKIKVAVIDTGIHASHLDLADGRVGAGYDVLADKAITANSNSDDNGHGTAVAGVIGATTNNKRGVAGINWDITLVPVKALDANGKGSISSIAYAIAWAANSGADIINLSVGGNSFGNDQTLNNAIIYAYERGALIVAAAGNDLLEQGINLDYSPVYPICADGGKNMVIGVAATDHNDVKATFSNYGKNCIDIMAPGRRILTTSYDPKDPKDNILVYGSGTSLAAPIVSGVAALLKSTNPFLNNDQIKNIILNSADNIDSLNRTACSNLSCNGFLGSGRINAFAALSPQPLINGTLVKENGSGLVYQISGGKKRLVYDFVFKQRNFSAGGVIQETSRQLDKFQTDIPLLPVTGTLIKGYSDPTVYYVDQDVKRPLTYLVFQSRKFSFSSVQTMPDNEVASFPTGEWYWPPDGVMVLIHDNPTVYVMDNGVKRPVTYFVFTQRQLSFVNVVKVTQDEFGHIPAAPDNYWLPPLENSMVKSETNDTVYLIQDGARRAITFEIFNARRLSFADIKVLPQAEIDVIPSGPVLNY